MIRSETSGKVQTVLGPIEPDSLGITHTHEHLLIDMGCYHETPDEASERAWIDAPVTMDRLGGLFRRVPTNLSAGKLLDVDTAIEELSRYRFAGGNSVVDATSIGVGRDPLALARISRATGINVVMGSSYYVPISYPADMDQRSEQSIADEIIRDVTVGVGDTRIRSGVIGEIGNFWPTNPTTERILRASAHAQQETGAPILIHPGFHDDSLPAIMQVLLEAGADASRTIMGHLDGFGDLGVLKDLAETGCYMEWDVFGWEDTTMPSTGGQAIEFASDVQRLQRIEYIIDQGFGDRVLIAHDVCTKMQLGRYGGKSYDHILTNIVPRMRKRGFSETQIKAILVDNPKTILTFK